MSEQVSPNTQAILLLAAPLLVGRKARMVRPLTAGEYRDLALHLRERRRTPADLLGPEADAVIHETRSVVEPERLRELLGRGFLLSQALERWEARAIWVISRADPAYPRRLKAHLKEDAPALLYGCGALGHLDAGGLAIVGSRHVEESLIHYAEETAGLAARAGRSVVSGGARGIDQAAMRGALASNGRAIGVLADSLERAALSREHREMLMDKRLVLVSPYDPAAGFNVGNAMQRNKLIYALSDAALVVSSDWNKGGTWAGAVEQLDRLRFVPVYVRPEHGAKGLDGLKKKGALPWPEPRDAEELSAVMSAQTAPDPAGFQRQLNL